MEPTVNIRRNAIPAVAWPMLLLGLIACVSWSVGGADEPVGHVTENAGAVPVHSPTVRNFGARGDGVSDDTDAIQQAVDAGVGAIRFPAGRYRLTRTVRIDLDRVGFTSLSGDGTARIIMDGPGPAFHLVGTHGGTAAPNTVQPGVWDRQRTPLIDGLEIVGRHPEACGVELTGTMQPTLTRLAVRDCLHAIHITHRNRNVQISDCHLYHNHGAGVYLHGVNLHQINIVGCHISYNAAGGIVVRDSEIRNLQVGTCDIEGNMGPTAPATANILLDCTTGSVREGAIVGCTIQHERHSPDSANIRFLGRADEPLMVGNFAISDNVFSDVRCNIDLKHARGVIITGNTFWEGFDHNLLAENCSHLVLGPNLFDRNPDYKELTSTNAIVLRNCRDCTLTGLHISHTVTTPAALTLENCSWCQLSDLHITDCENGGLRLVDCQSIRARGLLIRAPEQSEFLPVHVSGGTDVSVEQPNAVTPVSQ